MNGPTGYAVPLKRPAVDVKRLPDGGYIFRSPYGMREAPAHPNVWLKSWAETQGSRLFLVEKSAKGRKRALSYAQALASVQEIATALTAQAKSGRRAVVVFAANAIDTALFHLAAIEAGLPLATFDPNTGAHGNGAAAGLKARLAELAPAVVYVDTGERRAGLVEAAADCGAPVVVSGEVTGKAIELKSWLKKQPKGPDAHSGSAVTSQAGSIRIYFDSEISPSGVGVASRNLTLNQEAVSALLPPLGAPVALAAGEQPWWRPTGAWGLLAVLRAGGTLHVGDAADGLKATLLLAGASDLAVLAGDPKRFAALERIVVLDGAADLMLAAKIQELAVKARGHRIPLVWAYGAPRTGTLDTLLYYETETPSNLGLPPPGSFLKLAAVGSELELRVKPAGEAPLAWTSTGLAPCPLDEDGFLPTGDAVKLIDPMRPYLGIQRVGRLT